MSNTKFSFDHLNSTEFEEYCFELLKLMGYKNVNWRKGTGLDSSPSDQGRDIECDSPKVDIDKTEYSEHWFVDSKHYKRGVPPEKLQASLAWAEAEQPDVLLFIVSNFLSNPAKEYIQKYKQNKKPKFRIKVWEKPDLEDYSQGRTMLLNRYKLADKLAYLDIMHPAHLEYIKSSHINELDDLFELLDKLTDDEKMQVSGMMWEAFLQPRYKEAITGEETMGELRIDEVNYDLFKKKCHQLVKENILPSFLLTTFLVNEFLQETFSRGDTTAVDRYKARMRRYKDILEVIKPTKDLSPSRKTDAQKRLDKFIDQADTSYANAHKVYIKFCEEVVAKLLLLPGGSID